MQDTQRDSLIDSIIAIFRPLPKLSVVEWAESNLTLDRAFTSFPGPYSTKMTPYVREILNLFSDGNVERIVLCFGAQTSKTQTCLAGVAWSLVFEPAPAMWVMPNKNLGDDFSRSRMRPLLDSAAELRQLKRRNVRERVDSFAYDGATLTLVGSNSPANLASRPVRLLILDEVDKYPIKSKGNEASALELAMERTMSFPEPKIVEASTPTTADKLIWNDFLAGDQRRFFVPCPHCQKEILLTLNPAKTAFTRLLGCEAKLCWAPEAKVDTDTWDYKKVESTAYFECPHCRGKIYNHQKNEMLRLGRWRPTNPYADGSIRSYHLPTFYAPWRKASWGLLAAEFLKAKNSVIGLRNFINSKLAEPDSGQWEGDGGGRRELIVLNPTDENKPAERVRFMTCDRQKDYFYFLVREWYRNGDSLLIEWGQAANFDDLKANADRLGVKIVGVDNGYEAVDTNKNCASYDTPAQHWFSLRGDGRESWPHYDKRRRRIEKPFTLKRIDPLIGTRNEGRKYIWNLMWSNPSIKDILARFREPKTSPVRWAIPQKFATDEYFSQLNAEYKKRILTTSGRVAYVWTLRSSGWDNHLLDCECMNIALALYFNILKNIDGISPDDDAEESGTTNFN